MKKITLRQFAEFLDNFEFGIEINVSENEDGSNYWGIIKQKLFDGEVIVIGYYGGQRTEMFNPINQPELTELIDFLSYNLDKSENDFVYLTVSSFLIKPIIKYHWKGSIIEELPKIDAWRFIEAFYPDYDHCDDIMLNDDLACYLENEITREGFNERQKWLKDETHSDLKIMYDEQLIDFKNKALENFYELVIGNQITIIYE